MQLYEQFARHGVVYASGSADKELADGMGQLVREILPGIKSSVLVDAQNVSDYVDQMGTKEFDFSATDALTPPWTDIWLEWKTGVRSALYVHTDEPDLAMNETFGDAELRWVVTLCSFADGRELNHPGVLGPVTMSCFWLNSQGRLLKIPGHDDNYFGQIQTAISYKFSLEERREIGDEFLVKAIFACNFANCRNVERIEVLPSRQQRRLAERKGEPIYKHYVLAIDANTQRKVYPKGQPVPSNKRLHICRGHFATYTEAAPLFGKLTGRFWVPAHVRGKAESGFIDKDYRVKAPAR